MQYLFHCKHICLRRNVWIVNAGAVAVAVAFAFILRSLLLNASGAGSRMKSMAGCTSMPPSRSQSVQGSILVVNI